MAVTGKKNKLKGLSKQDLKACSDMISLSGNDNQLDMVIEECSELIQAICKYKRGKKSKKQLEPLIKHISEEAADVLIMLNQLCFIFPDNNINTWVKLKTERLEQRVNNFKKK